MLPWWFLAGASFQTKPGKHQMGWDGGLNAGATAWVTPCSGTAVSPELTESKMTQSGFMQVTKDVRALSLVSHAQKEPAKSRASNNVSHRTHPFAVGKCLF